MKSAILKFKGYTIEKMEYIRNNCKNFDNEEEIIAPEFLFKLVTNEEKTKANIVIGIKIGDRNESLFSVEAIVKGYFEIMDSTLGEDEINKYYLKNGTAILFPYVRAIITDLTSKSNHNPIILPTINFHSLIEKQDIQKMLLPISDYEEL